MDSLSTGHKRHTYVAPHGTTIQTSMRSVRAANVSERRLAAEADFAGGFETRCITPLQRPSSPEGKTGMLDDTRKRHGIWMCDGCFGTKTSKPIQ